MESPLSIVYVLFCLKLVLAETSKKERDTVSVRVLLRTLPLQHIQALIGQLKTTCSCEICTERSALISRYYSCNVVVVLFLRYLGDIMAHADSDSAINPTLTGLEAAYSMQRTSWKLAQSTQPT